MKPLLAWSAVLLACAVVGFRIVTNPATPHPVTAGVIVAVLILAGVYLALAEHFSTDQRCRRYERKVQRDMAKNLGVVLVLVAAPAQAGTVANVTSPDEGKVVLSMGDSSRISYGNTPGGEIALADGATINAEGIIYDYHAPDGKHLVQVCDCYRHQVYEIRARVEPNGPWYHVGANVPALQDVRNDIIVTNDRVVWVQGETASGSNYALRSSPIDVPGFSVVISHPHPQNGQGFDFPIQKISGDRVRFRSDPYVDETFEWWVVGVGGGVIYNEVFADGFESGGRARWQ